MRQASPTRALRASINHINWVRPAIILGLLLASAALAYLVPSRRIVILLIGLAPAVAAIAIYLRYPALGLLAVVFAAILVPFSIGTGTGTTLNPVILLVPALTAIWILDMGLRQGKIRFHRHKSIFFLLALVGVAGLSFVVGQLSWFDMAGAGAAAQLGGLIVFFISAGAFLLAAHTLYDKWLARLVYLFIAIGALVIIGRLVPPLGALLSPLVDGGALGSVFWIWLVALPASLALFNGELTPNKRVALAGITLLTLYVSFFRGGAWASGWAPPLVALLLLIWLRFPRWGWIALFLATLAFIAQFDRFWLLATNNESWLARRQAWQIVLDSVGVNPLLGLGPSNYYFYVEQATIMGWGTAWNVKFSSHNNWVDLIAQTGILGTLLFVGFAVSMAQCGWWLYNQLPNNFNRAYAAACVAGLIATLISGMLGDWFLPFVYNIGLAGMRASILFWIFLGGLLALYMRQDQSNPESDTPSVDVTV